MAKFKARLTAPSRTDKFYIHYQKGGYNTCIIINSATGYVLPNCVGYAQGRLLEILGKKAVNWNLPACNAEDWMETAKKNGFETGMMPQLGAVAVWSAGQTHNSKDGAGHVAVVEQIKANGDIVTSNSAYNGTEFYTKLITKASGYEYTSNRQFLGFIYCGIEFEEEKPQPKPSNIVAGKMVALKNTPCFNTSTATTAYSFKTGAYYLWDDEVVNGRIKITNSPSRVGVKGQVSCWINIADVGLIEKPKEQPKPTIKAGARQILNNVPVYTSATGKVVGYRSGIYYTWDDDVVNGRIKMTNAPSRVGVKGQVSFWLDVSNLK